MRSVLITGGTGYFGRGMVRHLLERTDAQRICVYSRGEYLQATMRQALKDPEERLHWFVGDVRDRARLRRAMEGVDTVIHAAALKRVEVGEYNPGEMVKTNIGGTVNVIEAATDAHVERVVYLSSDKACEPRNCYGATKLAAEKLVLAANNARGKNGPLFSVTRYGNVAGSTGSVIPTWRRNPAEAYITDEEATRFWMTLKEAIHLVLQVVYTCPGGKLHVPDIPAYRLGDLARAMNLPRPYRIVGLGKGEKQHERMLEDGPDSSQAQRLSIYDLKQRLAEVE